MGNPAEEKALFTNFIKAQPLFADVAVKHWDLTNNDPPDIVCNLEGGSTVGVELTSWLDEVEMGQAKQKEILDRAFEKLLRWERNDTDNLGLVCLYPKERLQTKDEQAFVVELRTLIDQLDKRWPTEPHWRSPQGFSWSNFDGLPTLKKHLDSLDVHPRLTSSKNNGGLGWLTVELRGGWYTPDLMVDALCHCIQAKVKKYPAKPANIDLFYLLVHYDKAFAYNPPVQAINFGYKEAVQAAAIKIGSAAGVFEKIFVYVFVPENEKVFQVFPERHL